MMAGLICAGIAACAAFEGPRGPEGAPGTSGLYVLKEGFFSYRFQGNARDDHAPLDISDTFDQCSVQSIPGTVRKYGASRTFYLRRGDAIGNNILWMQVTTSGNGTPQDAASGISVLKQTGNRLLALNVQASLVPTSGQDTLTLSSFVYDSVAGTIHGTFVIRGNTNSTQQPATTTGAFESRVVEVQ